MSMYNIKNAHPIVAEALQPVQTATTTRMRNGKLSMTDGSNTLGAHRRYRSATDQQGRLRAADTLSHAAATGRMSRAEAVGVLSRIIIGALRTNSVPSAARGRR
jgi:hypothetical protein